MQLLTPTNVDSIWKPIYVTDTGNAPPIAGPGSQIIPGVASNNTITPTMLRCERASICACRYSGRESQNLLTTTCAMSASVGIPPSTGRSGAGATITVSSQERQT